jgi:hypothetical protein
MRASWLPVQGWTVRQPRSRCAQSQDRTTAWMQEVEQRMEQLPSPETAASGWPFSWLLLFTSGSCPPPCGLAAPFAPLLRRSGHAKRSDSRAAGEWKLCSWPASKSWVRITRQDLTDPDHVESILLRLTQSSDGILGLMANQRILNHPDHLARFMQHRYNARL